MIYGFVNFWVMGCRILLLFCLQFIVAEPKRMMNVVVVLKFVSLIPQDVNELGLFCPFLIVVHLYQRKREMEINKNSTLL
jgi:hypothetical protein